MSEYRYNEGQMVKIVTHGNPSYLRMLGIDDPQALYKVVAIRTSPHMCKLRKNTSSSNNRPTPGWIDPRWFSPVQP